MSEEQELGILARRRIEAAIIAPIYDELRAEIGDARAQALISRAIRQAAIAAGKEFAAKTPDGPASRPSRTSSTSGPRTTR